MAEKVVVVVDLEEIHVLEVQICVDRVAVEKDEDENKIETVI